jgi:hypothetical protein
VTWTRAAAISTRQPDVDIAGIARPFLDAIVKQRLSRQCILGEMMTETSGVGSMLRLTPLVKLFRR